MRVFGAERRDGWMMLVRGIDGGGFCLCRIEVDGSCGWLIFFERAYQLALAQTGKSFVCQRVRECEGGMQCAYHGPFSLIKDTERECDRVSIFLLKYQKPQIKDVTIACYIRIRPN
jgi:hypothetical protein